MCIKPYAHIWISASCPVPTSASGDFKWLEIPSETRSLRSERVLLRALRIETAEALAELAHKRVREELGIAGVDSPRIGDLFHQKYRGSRYSFGYPACPNLEDQTKLFALFDPDETIGVHLTTVHHPTAKYFAA